MFYNKKDRKIANLTFENQVLRGEIYLANKSLLDCDKLRQESNRALLDLDKEYRRLFKAYTNLYELHTGVPQEEFEPFWVARAKRSKRLKNP